MASKQDSIRTPLARVRHKGAAKEGVGHFIAQRATAAALTLLVLLFLGAMVAYGGADYETTRAFLAHPVVTVLTALLIVAAFWHAKLGLQVVIEDYIQSEGSRIFWLIAVNFAAYGFGFAALYAVLRIGLSAP